MKQIYFLYIAVFAITACSGAGGDSAEETPVDIFRPYEKPVNAMSSSDVKYYAELNMAFGKLIPSPHAIFTAVVSGGSAKTVEVEERQKAIEKLSPEGLAVLKKIKKDCEIFPAFGAQWGDTQAREGAVSGERAQMSIAAKGCPLNYLEEGEVITQINRVRVNQAEQPAQTLSQVKLKQKIYGHLQDEKLRQATNIIESLLELNSVTDADVTVAKQAMVMLMKTTGSGRVLIRLADGDTVSGPIQFQMSMDSATGAMQTRSLLDLQTVRGALRIVSISTESQSELYINGEKADPADFGGVLNPQWGLGKTPKIFRQFYALLK
ncbi:MAG: hypothetical protein OM95_14510 [Bdellovibrio sp. ArHS]|uniref:hypothetical protein n=1 Tax=Bdellovibrio sp. ArHS TaxID=1569284 RepID=UPI00058305EA|nr:hypothetical protein [Bdellovibrio sp. ArHS]KHD87400.1 MAG: hypothetical protein OM95_14510 [Bdellovibrio sp. ArHS]